MCCTYRHNKRTSGILTRQYFAGSSLFLGCHNPSAIIIQIVDNNLLPQGIKPPAGLMFSAQDKYLFESLDA